MSKAIHRFRHLSLLTLAQFISGGASLFAVLFTSFTLGIAERGVVSFMLTTASVLAVFCTFGLYIPVSAFPGMRNERIPIGFVFALVVSTSVVAFLIMAASVGTFGLLVPPVGAGIVGTVVATTFLTFSQRVIQARVSTRKYLILVSLSAATLLIAASSTYWWPQWVIFACVFIFGQAMVAVLGCWMLLQDVGIQRHEGRAEGVRRALRVALPLAVGLIGQVLLWRGDTVALGVTTIAPSEVAVYSIAVAGTSVVWLPVEAVVLLLYRDFAVTNSVDEVQRRVIRSCVSAMCLSGFVGLVALAALVAVTRSILPQYVDAVGLYLILMVGVIPASAGRVLFASATAIRDVSVLRLFSMAAVASFFVYIPCAYVAQARGAAVASVVMYILTTLLLLRVLPLSRTGPVA